MTEDFYISPSEAERLALVARYEQMLSNNGNDYFDEDEFEVIINHYLDMNMTMEALQAADCGNRQHPFSSDMKLQYAKALIEKGDVLPALQILQQIEGELVNDPEVFFLKGLAYLWNNNSPGALELFEQAAEFADPEEKVWYYMSIVEALIEAELFDAALPYLLLTYELEPNDLEVLYDLAYCYERLNDFDSSLKYRELHVKQVPFNDYAWYNLGTIYGRQGYYEKAIQAFQFAVTINDKHSSAYYNMGATFVQQEQYTEAIESFRLFLALEPESAEAYLSIGECYQALDDYDNAIVALRKAVEFNNNIAEAHFLLSLNYSQIGEMDKALEHIARAIAIDEKYAVYWFESAALHYFSGNKEEFLRSLHHGLYLDAYSAWDFFRERCPDALNDPKIIRIYDFYKQKHDDKKI